MRRYIKRNSVNVSKDKIENITKNTKDVVKRSYRQRRNKLKAYTIDQVLNIFLHKNKTENMIIECFTDLDTCIESLTIKGNQTKYGIINPKDYYSIDGKERDFFSSGIDEEKAKNGVVSIINGMEIYASDKCPEKTLIFFGRNKYKNFIFAVDNIDFGIRYVIN